ncbi:WGR domain-containing protein [Variovorax saccharolyticus]|uniref:WGR domain-containing protein n=1 Tax=Variovorax saccharolyticus TaxID=3053516 RepID=UPI002576255C|nr:WGR domain-containing protein [Variovorax sp. J31P216]MDM0029091.1 WGR domain-containing protein [Variovorax sp. J31P216]
MHRWENPAERRYYQATVQQNLFGDWELVRIWGGIGSARGRLTATPLCAASEGQGALAQIATRRAHRGYALVCGMEAIE